jgi:neutral ceramidase
MTTTESGQLRVGAAKVDITPPEDALPSDYKSIHDPIYARAIVLDNRHTKAVLLGIDVVMLLEGVYTELAQQIMAEVGCPIENILMTATHTHASPGIGPDGFSKVRTPFDAQQAERLKQGAFEAVRQAHANLQPARVGYGTGLF